MHLGIFNVGWFICKLLDDYATVDDLPGRVRRRS